ncbi:TadE/TadG family type IV pilus assembly protein [Methylocucumis oryzae]|uniref:TadE/TadG family type IV pilus assembly protein n=1 Tax=Methylocucumis oryzae TaxID=1632867 RepID=UPI000696E5F9|nr:TadE family protein [Methylocucumis oryzae]
MKKLESGLILVETALFTMFILLIVLSIAEVGRAFYQYNQLVIATRNATRYFAVSANPGPADTVGAQNLLVFGNVIGAGDAILPNLQTSDVAPVVGGNFVNVSASYTFNFLPGNPLANITALFGSSIPALTLNTSLSMQIFTP